MNVEAYNNTSRDTNSLLITYLILKINVSLTVIDHNHLMCTWVYVAVHGCMYSQVCVCAYNIMYMSGCVCK